MAMKLSRSKTTVESSGIVDAPLERILPGIPPVPGFVHRDGEGFHGVSLPTAIC